MNFFKRARKNEEELEFYAGYGAVWFANQIDQDQDHIPLSSKEGQRGHDLALRHISLSSNDREELVALQDKIEQARGVLK